MWKTKIKKSTLVNAFTNMHPITLPNAKRPWELLHGPITALELEDGSGRNFNVKIDGVWTFVRTIAD